MISIEEKNKIILYRIRYCRDLLNNISYETPLLSFGDPQIDINSLKYADLVKRIKALENELGLLTNNDQ